MRHRLKFIDLFAGLGDSLQYSKSYYRGAETVMSSYGRGASKLGTLFFVCVNLY